MKRLWLVLAFGLALILVASTGPTSACPFQSYLVYMPLVERHVMPVQGAGATYADCDRIAASGLTVFYDWSPDPPACPSAKRLAMIWGRNQVGAEVADDVEIVLGFNEPELEGQANITPTLAAEMWVQIEQDYPDKLLATPSANTWWLSQWVNAFQAIKGRPPRFEYVAHHCYGAYSADLAISKCTTMAQHVADWARAYGAKVLVTEFAHLPCWPEGDAGTLGFMEGMVLFYRQDPDIEMWFWFENFYYGTESWAFGPYCNTSLVNEDGTLTVFGEKYRELGQERW